MDDLIEDGGLPGEGRGEALAATPVLSSRAFWAMFASALGAYAALTWTSQMLLMGVDSPLIAAMRSLLEAAVLALPSGFFAWHRRAWLAPHPSLRSFLLHKIAGGLVFGVCVAALVGVLSLVAPTEMPEGVHATPSALIVGWFLFGLLVYTVLMFFLMWEDALDRAHRSRELAAREAALRSQAESKALRAQFNPHFVFNTLHSLMLLVRKEPDTAERAIEDVAALIRYASTLQRREVDRVSLDKELEFARRYISLEKLRLADRLSVEWDIEPGLDDVLVPAFSLQTLLENAIKHGISPKSSGGTVRITASTDGDDVLLLVDDDGTGADPAAVTGNGGSGLDLLDRRLRAVYGADASLDWATSVGEGFRATVRVPARRLSAAQLG